MSRERLAGWKQCFGMVNTAADDVQANALDGCLPAERLRVGFSTGGPPTLAPGRVDGNELAVPGCYGGKQHIGIKVAVYR